MLLLALWLTTLRAAAVPLKDFGSAQPFHSGDTVCFVGDSITQNGGYHSLVSLFYATRFPERTISFWNCGIGGDRAGGIMTHPAFRLAADILGRKPTVATVMLGMNDIGHGDYGLGKTGAEVEQRRRGSLAAYDAHMRRLIGALQASGARVILITPSIYDETTTLAAARPNVGPGRNAALGECAEKVRAWSAEFRTGLVKLHEAMNALNAREQAKYPAFTIIGPDRVHPGPIGHFVMAHIFLKAQGMPREVARIAIDAAQAKAVEAVNCRIEKVTATASGVEFDCLEKALPLVVPEEARPALALVPFMRELNQEQFVVSGLAGGSYDLKIDGGSVGEFTADELRAGIDLAENPKTPQYRQSAAATKLNAERMGVAARLRAIAAQYYRASIAGIDVSNRAAMEKGLRAQNDAARAAGKAPDPRWVALLDTPHEPAASEQEYAKLSTAFASACQPRQHHFALARK